MGERILENFTIDQLAGSTALILGAVGGLLTIIWKSRCLCKCRVGLSDKCYIFDCSREPPPIETLTEEEKQDEKDDKQEEKEEGESLVPTTSKPLSKTKSKDIPELIYDEEPEKQLEPEPQQP